MIKQQAVSSLIIWIVSWSCRRSSPTLKITLSPEEDKEGGVGAAATSPVGMDIIWFSCCSSRCLAVSDVFGTLSMVEKVILRGTVFEGKYEQPLEEKFI